MYSRVSAPPAYENQAEKFEQKASIGNLDETLADLGLSDHRTRVVFVLDISGSMDDGTVEDRPTSLILGGHMDRIIRQLARLARVFDDDGKMQIYSFGKTVNSDVVILDVTSDEAIYNFSVQQDIIEPLENKSIRYDTNYAPVMNKIISDFYPKNEKSPGKKIRNDGEGLFVFWVTDGDCHDCSASLDAFIRASYCGGLFLKLIGLGDANFSFLEKLDDLKVKGGCCGLFSGKNTRLIDNVDFKDFSVSSLKEGRISYELILEEYVPFLVESKALGLVSGDRGLTGNASDMKNFKVEGRMGRGVR